MSKNCQLYNGNRIVIFAIEKKDNGRKEYDGYFWAPHRDLQEITERHIEDNSEFTGLPEEPGVYVCDILCEWIGGGGEYPEEADLTLHIRDLKRIAAFEQEEATRVDMQWGDAFPERAKAEEEYWKEELEKAEAYSREQAAKVEAGGSPE